MALEERGVPVAAFAVDTLVKTVGKSIARLHGYPNYPYVEIPAPFVEGVMIPEEMFKEKVANAVARAERLLTKEKLANG